MLTDLSYIVSLPNIWVLTCKQYISIINQLLDNVKILEVETQSDFCNFWFCILQQACIPFEGPDITKIRSTFENPIYLTFCRTYRTFIGLLDRKISFSFVDLDSCFLPPFEPVLEFFFFCAATIDNSKIIPTKT